MTKALKIYKELKKKGIDVLLDDADDNIAKITLPIWLYVSVTGVLIYLMLY